MDWDVFKVVALISAIVTILDKAITYGDLILKKMFVTHMWVTQ
jgi:hypothetical protein